MATKLNFDQLKGQIERLRKDSLEVVANANKIVYGGVQKLADKELKALNDYYKSALASIKAARKDSIKDVAHKQIDLLQETVNQVIAHARESVGVVAEARAELAKLVQHHANGKPVSESRLGKAVAPARKALAKAKAKAGAASGQAAKVVKSAQKTAKTEAKKVRTEVKAAGKTATKTASKTAKKVESRVRQVASKVSVEAKAGVAAAKKAVAPSPDSRASRATSKAKETVGAAVGSATAAVNNAVSAVVDAVKPSN